LDALRGVSTTPHGSTSKAKGCIYRLTQKNTIFHVKFELKSKEKTISNRLQATIIIFFFFFFSFKYLAAGKSNQKKSKVTF
jgi:hypothetical protein